MVPGAEHHAHPTGADRFGNLVMSDSCTYSERHIQVGDILVPHSGAGDLRSHKNEVSPSARGGAPIRTYRDTFVRWIPTRGFGFMRWTNSKQGEQHDTSHCDRTTHRADDRQECDSAVSVRGSGSGIDRFAQAHQRDTVA